MALLVVLLVEDRRPAASGAELSRVSFKTGSPAWGFRQWNAEDLEGEDVRYASVGQLSLTYWVNRPLRRQTVLNIVWLG
ncbi:hypothetical protein [Streptomyces sp. NPDC006510]|uniref:hypothetical protein n=1 Tax=unclassified Streptomyces TaxID=2593676 RepID=UPI0033A46169